MPSPSGGAAPAAGSSGTGTGPSANVYTPANQPWTDTQFSNLLSGIYGPALAGLPQQTPASQAYPGVQSAVGQLTNNPYAAQAQGASNNVANLYGAYEPNIAQQGSNLVNQAIQQGGYGADLQNLAFNPTYANALANLNSPAYLDLQHQAQVGAQQAAGIGTAGATQAANNATALSGTVPGQLQIAQQIAQPIARTQALGDQVATPIQGLQQAGASVWDTAQDPRQALYNRTLNQVQQQQNVANAQAGIAATPYGASVAGDATRNFNIDWQNQQLQRQLAGLAGLGQADTQAAGLGTAAGGLYDTAAQIGTRSAATDALAGQTAQSALGLNEGATNLAQAASAAPLNLQNSMVQTQLGVANAGLDAGLAGVQGIDQLLATQGNAVAQGAGITNNALQALNQGGQLPYQTSTGQAQTALGALGNQITAGNQQYVPAQQAIQDAESYLNLGQSASNISGNLGALGTNQANQAFQGIGTAAGLGSNLLFGNQGLSGALGLGSGGLVGALGGGGGGIANDAALAAVVNAAPNTAAAGASDAILGPSAFLDASGGVSSANVLGDAGAAASGGGFSIADLLPTAALS